MTHMNGRAAELSLYRRIYAILVCLTAATVGAWVFGGAGRMVAVTVALAIAGSKAALIGLYFMHLKDERPVIWAVLGTGVLAVVILAIGIFPDVAIRAGQ